MTKKLFLGIALLAALVSCNKEQINQAPASGQGKALVIGATIDPVTKMDYTEQGDGSYKVTFLANGSDALYAYFVQATSASTVKVLGAPVKLSIDLTSVSADMRSANFVAGSVIVPEGATHVYTFFANGGTDITYADSVTVNLATQADIVAACKKHLIGGVVPISSLTEDDSKFTISSVPLEYYTSLVKFDLTLPEGDTLKAGATPYVELSGPGVIDALNLLGKNQTIGYHLGKLTFNAPAIKDDTNKLTVYGVIVAAAGANYTASKVTVWDGSVSYVADFAPTVTLAGGKAYTAARTLVPGSVTTDKWVPDEAGSLDWETSGVTATADWLTFAENKLNWAANTTGSVRTATATDAKGDKYIITQIGANEFTGNWKLTSKIFSKNSFVAAADPGTKTGITIGAPLLGETLVDVDGKSYTNQLGVRGLYYDAVMDATADIDYEAKTIRVGMFLDARNNAQAVSNGVSGYNYACFLPGMGTKTDASLWASPWNFVQPDLSNTYETDYTWLWFTVSEDLKTLHYNPNTAATMQTLNTSAAGSASQICAITVAISKSANVTAADVRTDWDVVYQGNAYSGKPGGLLFEKVE